MKKIDFMNQTAKIVRLSVEPNPDQYDIPSGGRAQLRGSFDFRNEILEVSLFDDGGEPTLVFYSKGDVEVVIDGTASKPR